MNGASPITPASSVADAGTFSAMPTPDGTLAPACGRGAVSLTRIAALCVSPLAMARLPRFSRASDPSAVDAMTAPFRSSASAGIAKPSPSQSLD